MHNINPFGLFDEENLLKKLTKLGDPLQELNHYINWKLFQEPIEKAFYDVMKQLSKGGRPPFCKLMLFKALIIQSLYNLSDEQLEYQIVDRASFKRFLGLKSSDKVPDSRTFWLFREQLIEKGLILSLFKIFNEALDAAGILANEGKIIDASFVEVPRQRNNKDENKHIKETGTAPDEWKDKPHKSAQKDIDATWTKKNNTTFYGYKNHVKADAKTKIIIDYIVTDAAVHDSQTIDDLITASDEGQEIYADSAYTGEKQEKIYEEKKSHTKNKRKRLQEQTINRRTKSK